MNIFVARQPIFDKNKNVVAYELLYRNNLNNKYTAEDGNKATYKLIANSFYMIGVERLTEGKRALINFTEDLLKEEIGAMLPKELVVIEILETVEPTKEVLEACTRLKNKGYIIALDDFVFHEKYKEFIELADIIKIDFTITLNEERKNIMKRIDKKNIKFLAEKVETEEEFKEAISYGYTYFQGYFFSKPSIISAKDIPVNKLAHMKILDNLNNMDFEDLEVLIKQDVALSYKLLKTVNSSFYGFKNKVGSIKQAMSLIGEEEMFKWVYIIIVNSISEDVPNELVKTSLIRAKFCEEIAIKTKLHKYKFNVYITGLLSVIDVMLDIPMKEAIKNLAVPDEVKYALLGGNNYLNNILKLVISYEAGDWDSTLIMSNVIKLSDDSIGECYLKALEWVDNFFTR